jgi:S1-C subfamily serine protease
VDYPTVMLRDRDQLRGKERLSDVPDGGVLVIEVESGSPAEKAGIPTGANAPIITHIGGTQVRTPAEFYDAAKKQKGNVELRTDAGNFSVAE